MPKCFTTPEERRAYFRAWQQTPKGVASRKRIIIERAIANRRCPAPRTLQQYNIGGDDLERIISARRGTEAVLEG
jgi:hypothetical protein